MTPKQIARFWARVDRSGGPDACWLWLGYISPNGYGKVWDGTRITYAHRIAYQEARGPIPAGLVIDHLCRNRACVRPAHLEVVTPRENVLRGIAPNILAFLDNRCTHGHTLTAENRFVIQDRRRGLIIRCRQCRLEAMARMRLRRRLAALESAA